MTPFLAPRSSTQSRPSSATPTYKTQRSTTKTVHFEDEVDSGPLKSPLGRSVSAGKGKGKRFLFPRKKQLTPAEKKEKKGEKKRGKNSESVKKSVQHSRSSSMEGERRRSRSPETSRRSCSPPLGSESPMSVRSAPSNIERFQLKPHHRYFLPPSPLHQPPSGLEDSRLSNVYDLFAVCNHSGTLSRGHYTAFCKNPTDGRWYSYDDSAVQPISDDQLITAGAYMLFYVRQSLLSSSPLSSSESSQSSCSSANHWINHMPPFKLDLNDYHEELCQMQQGQRQTTQFSQQGYDTQTDFQAGVGEVRSRARLSSSNSVLSAPPNMGHRVSPPAPAPDVDSITSPGSGSGHTHYPVHDSRSDAFSAVSLPPYHPSRTLNSNLHHTPYSQAYHATNRSMTDGVASTRPQSMRLRREQRGSGGWGTHTPQRGYPNQQRSHEDLHSQASYDSHLQGHVAPTRSIPSLPTSSEYNHTPNRYSQEPHRSFQTSQNLRQYQPTARSNGHIPIHIGSHFKSPSLARSGATASNQPESCV